MFRLKRSPKRIAAWSLRKHRIMRKVLRTKKHPKKLGKLVQNQCLPWTRRKESKQGGILGMGRSQSFLIQRGAWLKST